MYLIHALLGAALLSTIPNFYFLWRRQTSWNLLTTGTQIVLLMLSWEMLLSSPLDFSVQLRLWIALYSLILGLYMQRVVGSSRLLRLSAGAITFLWMMAALCPHLFFEEVAWNENYTELAYGWLGALYLLGWLAQIIVILLRFDHVYPSRPLRLIRSMIPWLGQLVCIGLMSGYFLPRTDVMVIVAGLVTLAGIPQGAGQSNLAVSSQKLNVSRELREKLYLPSLVGLYLFVMGGIGLLAQILHWDLNWLQAIAAATGLLIPLLVILLWPSLQHRFRQFVGRHLYSSQYDYRVIWERVSDELFSVHGTEHLVPRFADIINDILGVSDVALYRVGDHSRLSLMYSTTGSLRELGPLDASLLEWLWRLAGSHLKPEEIPARFQEPARKLRACGVELVLPIGAAGRLVALIFLGPKRHGDYSLEDCQLLQTIAHQFGVVVHNLQLNEELALEHELGSITRMSAFVLHDLKNATAMLTLMRQNLEHNWDNPQFREDLVFTFEGIQERIQRVIEKFSATRQEGLNLQKVDLVSILDDAIQQSGLLANERIQVHAELHCKPQIIADVERMTSVFENLLLNAIEAIEGKNGRIDILTVREEDDLILEFKDNGVGIPQDFLTHRLFKPFQTTKPRGLGIGLYQCRTTIEAHGGTIEALVGDNCGTTMRIQLPLS